MKIENAIDFLLFAYFGITLDDENDIITDKIIDRAYRDASSRVLSVNEGNENCKDDAKKHIKCFLENIKTNDFQQMHNNCATELVKLYEGKTDSEHKFTYGIAQKWLNMSVKYLVIVLKILEEQNAKSSFFKSYKDCVLSFETNCDVPIDDYILEVVSLSKKKKFENGLSLKIASQKGDENVTYGSGKYKRWSKYEFDHNTWLEQNDDYHKLQQEIKNEARLTEGDSILDWENKAWIEVAKKRKR